MEAVIDWDRSAIRMRSNMGDKRGHTVQRQLLHVWSTLLRAIGKLGLHLSCALLGLLNFRKVKSTLQLGSREGCGGRSRNTFRLWDKILPKVVWFLNARKGVVWTATERNGSTVTSCQHFFKMRPTGC